LLYRPLASAQLVSNFANAFFVNKSSRDHQRWSGASDSTNYARIRLRSISSEALKSGSSSDVLFPSFCQWFESTLAAIP
jgi:hypothetical protein